MVLLTLLTSENGEKSVQTKVDQMGQNTGISWADDTFNPWIGCVKVSPGCANCYAERDFDHRFKKAQWGRHFSRVKTSPKNWEKPLFWNSEAYRSGRRRFVFCASLADVFEEPKHKMFDQWGNQRCISEARKQLFNLIDRTHSLIWLLLTKRPEHIRDCWDWCGGYRPNVMIGVSVENQQALDQRVPILLEHKDLTSSFFVSCEPLLEPITFNRSGAQSRFANPESYLRDESGFIRWVIAGGESGPNARAIKADWIDSLRDECEVNSVPFFFKQWGANSYGYNPNSDFINGKQFHNQPEKCRLIVPGGIHWQ